MFRLYQIKGATHIHKGLGLPYKCHATKQMVDYHNHYLAWYVCVLVHTLSGISYIVSFYQTDISLLIRVNM